MSFNSHSIGPHVAIGPVWAQQPSSSLLSFLCFFSFLAFFSFLSSQGRCLCRSANLTCYEHFRRIFSFFDFFSFPFSMAHFQVTTFWLKLLCRFSRFGWIMMCSRDRMCAASKLLTLYLDSFLTKNPSLDFPLFWRPSMAETGALLPCHCHSPSLLSCTRSWPAHDCPM